MDTQRLAEHLAGQLPPPRARRTRGERAGMTQAELAEVLGVSRQTITRWEAGMSPGARTGASTPTR